MRAKLSFIILVLAAGVASAEDTTKSALERDFKGWVNLFPGKDLEGWKRVPLAPDTKLNEKNAWKVEGELLLCDGVGVKEMLLYEKEFGDGIFHVEWRFRKVERKPDYNSGVYVRSKADGREWLQVQVVHQEKPPLLGDIFADKLVNGKIERVIIRGKGPERANPPGEWNTYEVTAKGKTVSVWINGATTGTWDACPWETGHVGLQAEFFFIEFRNLKFKPLQ
jgi:hypothetical protein